METSLNSMWQKASVLKTPGRPLKDPLAAIAMEISRPPTYSTLRTILMAADDKLTTDAFNSGIPIEERSRNIALTHLALATETAGQSKGKRKGKGSQEIKGKKSSTYCSKSGQTDDERWAKNATTRSKEKDDASKEETEEKGLAARIANMGSTYLPPLCPFVARQTIPTQREWIVDSGASAHTRRERNQFILYRALWPPHPVSLRNGKTVSVLDTGDNLNRASKPSIAGDSTPRETFTKNKQLVRRLQTPERRAPRDDVPNVNRPGDDSRMSSRRPAMASTNSASQSVQPQLNKPKSNGVDGESRRLAITSTYSLSHLTVDGKHLNITKAEGLACGIGPQPIKSLSNIPGGPRTPTSIMGDSDVSTTRAPAWRRQGEAENGSVNQSVRSDRGRSRHQGNSTPKFKSGGEMIRTEVRKDKRQIDEEGITYQRAPNQPLDLLTRNAPAIGKMDLRAPTSTVEDADGPTTRVPAWKRQKDTVNGSVDTSVPSDQRGLRHLGELAPNFEFGAKTAKADVRRDKERTDGDGNTYQRIQNRPLNPLTRNVPPTGEMEDWRAPTSAESSDGPTTQAPGLKQQEDAVNKLEKPSDRSDRSRSRHQGDLTPKFKFGGEEIETDVRSDEKRTDGDGHTSQRVQNRPLDPPTRIAPPTGQTDDLEGPTCAQSGDPHHNDLETCENGCKKNYKRRKRSAKANGIKDSPCPVETDSNKSCSVDYSNAKAATESCDPSLTASAQRSTKGLTAHCNAFDRRDLWSTVTPNILCVRPPAHSLEEVENPSNHSAIKTDNPPSASITNLTTTKADTATNAL